MLSTAVNVPLKTEFAKPFKKYKSLNKTFLLFGVSIQFHKQIVDDECAVNL